MRRARGKVKKWGKIELTTDNKKEGLPRRKSMAFELIYFQANLFVDLRIYYF